MQLNVTMEGYQEIKAGLDSLGSKQAILAIKAALRRSAGPMVRATKAFTPVRSGALQASIGAATENVSDLRGAAIGATVGPRRVFSMTTGETIRAGARTLAKRLLFGARGQRASKALAKGHLLGKALGPAVYGKWVNQGFSPTRGWVRKAGPAMFMQKGFAYGAEPSLRQFGFELREEIKRRAAKMRRGLIKK